jgi:hypothetical protein
MATYSLNQLIKIFSDFADSHFQINSFGFGEVFEANGNPKVTGNTPTLWVFPTQATPLENTTIYSFDVRCWDLVTKGEENENDVLSDCQQTLFDFIQFIKHNEIFDINVSGDPSLTPFTEQLADDVTGWECSIDIEVNSINSDCMIPMGVITPFPNPLNCEPVIVTDNGNQITLDAGDTYTCLGGGCGDVDVLINGSTWGSFTAPDTEDIPVKNTAGTNLGSKVGANWQIANITLTQPNGSNESKVAGINLACTLIGALDNQDLNDDLTPTQINQIQRQQPTRTGQTTSYRTGDDGDLELGIGASFSTLSDNNIFGNTNRFTSELGTQTYTNNFVLDHSTGLMWYIALVTGTQWNAAIDGALASTQGAFTDWILPNINQLISICNFSIVTNSLLNYSPFNIAITTTTDRIWTSTTTPSATVNAYTLYNLGQITGTGKSTTQSYIICRKFIPADFGL